MGDIREINIGRFETLMSTVKRDGIEDLLEYIRKSF